MTRMIYPFDLERDGKAPYPSTIDLFTLTDLALRDAGAAMMRGDIAYARDWCVEAAKLRDMRQTRAERAVLIAGYDERKAQREARSASQ